MDTPATTTAPNQAGRSSATALSKATSASSTRSINVVGDEDRGFFRLPREIRIEIYRFVLQPEVDQVELQYAEVAAPTYDILLTCRLIHGEAHKIFDTASRKFWRDTDFEVDLDDGGCTYAMCLLTINTHHLGTISHISVDCSFLKFMGGRIRLIITKVDERRKLWQLGWEDEATIPGTDAQRNESPMPQMYIALLLARLRSRTLDSRDRFELNLQECQRDVRAEIEATADGEAIMNFLGLSVCSMGI